MEEFRVFGRADLAELTRHLAEMGASPASSLRLTRYLDLADPGVRVLVPAVSAVGVRVALLSRFLAQGGVLLEPRLLGAGEPGWGKALRAAVAYAAERGVRRAVLRPCPAGPPEQEAAGAGFVPWVALTTLELDVCRALASRDWSVGGARVEWVSYTPDREELFRNVHAMVFSRTGGRLPESFLCEADEHWLDAVVSGAEGEFAPGLSLVFLLGGAPVGEVLVVRPSPGRAQLAAAGVVVRSRHAGVATAAFGVLLGLLEVAGVRVLRVELAGDNKTALAIARRWGFEPVATRRQLRWEH
ncbi:MAG: hypothetical protein K6U08_01755 [Firmicutes bacterium]|nr:hypothetical protein [Bacillota bacterium]